MNCDNYSCHHQKSIGSINLCQKMFISDRCMQTNIILRARDCSSKVKGSRGQSEQSSLLVVYYVFLNVKGKSESESFSRHLVHDPLVIIVPEGATHFLICHVWLILVCTP